MAQFQAIEDAKVEFKKIKEHLLSEFSRLQVGRASAVLVEDIPVEAYGSTQPVKALASVSIPDARTIQIQPWDKGLLSHIEKAIVGVGTGLNPKNDGICIRISIPPLTEERRKELTKVVGKMTEESKISVRSVRQDAQKVFKNQKANSEITEDDFFVAEKLLQDSVDAVNKDIEGLAEKKEADIMTV
ncbi:MAG: ribosome recycling factor [Candidatus Gracilibacteria bacterium]|jgi:ribosome recycling factor|nr:ribosome recycling factor [Candidatus Gracilibacteria bacterium]